MMQRSLFVRRFQLLCGWLLVIGLLVWVWPVGAQATPERYSDGAFSFLYPEHWSDKVLAQGVIGIASSYSAFYDAAAGEMDEGDVLIQIVKPQLLAEIIARQPEPPTTPEAVLMMFSVLNSSANLGRIQSITINDLPAAVSFYANSGLSFSSYAITLEGGQFAAFDVVTDSSSEQTRYESVVLAIAATMRYADPLLHTLAGPVLSVDALAFSADGTALAAGGLDGVFVWDAATGANQVQVSKPEAGVIRALSFTADGALLALGDDNEMLRVWDTTSDQIVHELAYPPGAVYTFGAAFSPDMTRIASVAALDADTSYLTVWDRVTGEVVHQTEIINAIGEPLIYVSYSPVGTLIGTAGRSYPVYLHDAATGAVVGEIGHALIEEQIYGTPLFSPDGKWLAVACLYSDDAVFVWNTTTGELVNELYTDLDDDVQVMAFSPDGSLFATGGDDDAVRVWDVATWTELTPLLGHDDDIANLAFSPDGTRLVSADASGEIKVWDLSIALAASASE